MEKGFVYVTDVIDNCILEIRYYSSYNFVGERIDGYNKPFAILSVESCVALKKASDYFNSLGYIIKIYDCYRPQKAVDHFVRWANDDGSDIQGLQVSWKQTFNMPLPCERCQKFCSSRNFTAVVEQDYRREEL